MPIGRADVDRLALLARLDLSPAEHESFPAQIGAVLDHVDRLKEVDVAGVEPFAHTGTLSTVVRDDAPRPSLTPDQALANAPARLGTYLVVPRVLEQP